MGIVKQLLLGQPLPTSAAAHERLGRPAAIAAFGLDALSSIAYAPQEILFVLVLAGANLRVAEDLGAEVLQVEGDVVTELTRVARERNVTRIVIGQSPRSRVYELLQRSVVDRLLRALPDIDVNVVANESTGSDSRRRRQ